MDVVEECNHQTCPEWTEWGEWTPCSKSCAGGQRRKFRQCVDNGVTVDESQCTGDHESSEECNTQDCPYWTDWSDWTECSKTCGGGSRSKVFVFQALLSTLKHFRVLPSQIRECKIPLALRAAGKNTTVPCEGGDAKVAEACNTEVCPSWTEWTDWTPCTTSCGGGTQRRIRDCVIISENQDR